MVLMKRKYEEVVKYRRKVIKRILKGHADQTEKLSSNQVIVIDRRLWYHIWSRGGTEKAYGR